MEPCYCAWCGNRTLNPLGFCSDICYENYESTKDDPSLWDADTLAEIGELNIENGKVNR